MEQKDRYTLRELFNNLEITMTELKNRSGISDVTLINVRSGQSARLRTINILLRVFSEIYGLKFSLDNVDGIIIQGQPVDAIIHPAEKPAKARVSASTPNNAARTEDAQISPTIRNLGGAVKTDIPADLPDGTMKLIDFVEAHGLPQSSLSYYVSKGYKGEKIETTQRPRASGPGMQHFFTPEQQTKALDFLRRHGKLKPVAEEPAWYMPDSE